MEAGGKQRRSNRGPKVQKQRQGGRQGANRMATGEQGGPNLLRKCTMHTSLNAVRTTVTNRADSAVMRDRIQMGKPLVATRGSRGTRNEAHRSTNGRPWTRVQAPGESCGLQAPRGTRRACHWRKSGEERQWPRPQAVLPLLGKGLRPTSKKFRHTRVTHQEIVGEDKSTP